LSLYVEKAPIGAFFVV